MVVIERAEKIVNFKDIPKAERINLKHYFDTHQDVLIVEIEIDKYYTRQLISKGEAAADIRVNYNPDMFLYAIPFITRYGYAIADDESGNHVAVLKNQPCTYVHRYKYDGGMDLWFLDRYECLFLHGCNEFSVELCRSALKLWKGKRLILVGNDWEPLIPLLPDLPQLNCYYEPQLGEERFSALIEDKKFLHIIYGTPHEESMERYQLGIMYYDEIMSFTYMFSDYRNMGERNQDKKFFVMNGYYGNLGLFAIYGKVVDCAMYAKSKGFIPVIQLTMTKGSFYQNDDHDDIWGTFFNQPEIYTVDEVMNSQNVFFSPGFYNGSVQSAIMRQACGDNISLSWPHGMYNQKVLSYVKEKQEAFLPYPEKTLGVLARGTDYVNTHLKNHSVHASLELICEKIDEVWNLWGDFEYIYVATEDEAYCEYFKKRYGDRVYFTDQKRYRTEAGELLADLHRKETSKRDGYLMGAEYIASITLLSKCHSLIASGHCASVYQALKENNEKYKNVFIFELGMNK